MTVKTFIMSQNTYISISNKLSSFKLSIYQNIIKKNYHNFQKKKIIRKHLNKCFLTANQHITMISEESCDTEDWSNGC